MATINDLHRSISDMNEGELFSFIREMRNTRRIFKQRKIQTRTSIVKPKKQAVDKMLNSLTKEEALALLTKIQGGN